MRWDWQADDVFTVVSYNRPLTRQAKENLEEFDIVNINSVNELGCWTEVEVETKPDSSILEKHELSVRSTPDNVFETEHGERVEIYEDSVVVDGVETTVDPEVAVKHADENGWGQIND